MYCSHCGTEFEGNFCPECGAKAEMPTRVVPPPVHQPAPPQQPVAPPLQMNAAPVKRFKKSKKPIYKKWWFYVLLAIVTIAVMSTISGGVGKRGKKIEWSKVELSSQLPEPPSSRGTLYENSEEKFWASLDDVTDDQYNDYLHACMDRGFSVDAVKNSYSYKAYNSDGYSLDMSHIGDSLSITLKAPMKFSTITWPTSRIGKLLPTPKSTTGKFSYEYEEHFFVYVGNTTKADYDQYVAECSARGFTVQYEKGDTYYRADNAEGYHISLRYEGNNIMSVEIKAPKNDNTSASGQAPSENTGSQMSNERTERNGFDSATNEVYHLASYTVEIPKYWGDERSISDGIQRYAETGGKVAMLQITAQWENDESYPVSFDGLMSDNDNMISMLESTAFSEVTEYEVVDTGVIKGILYKGTIIDQDSGLSGYGEWFVFASEGDRNWCTLVVSQTDNTDYLYTADFMKMIFSIKPSDHQSEVETTTIAVTMSDDDFGGMNYKEAEQHFREMGFSSFEYRTVESAVESAADTICYIEITESFIGDSSFVKGDKFASDSTVTFFYYRYEAPKEPSPVYYSTNDYETAKKGNSGVFAYKSKSGTYDIYWIIDFDEGYVYWFTDGNGDSTCDKVKIESGTLNDAVIITYHDGGSEWSYKLHFKYVDHPETLIMIDQNGFDYKYSPTDLDDALAIRNTKTIYDY